MACGVQNITSAKYQNFKMVIKFDKIDAIATFWKGVQDPSFIRMS